MNRLENDAMDGVSAHVSRIPAALLRASLGCVALVPLIMLSSGASAQSQVASPPAEAQTQAIHSISVNGDTATGDNPDLDIREVASGKPVAGGAQPVVSPAVITNEQLGSLIDRDVEAVTGGNLGHIVDVLIDADGEMQAVVIDIGGFLGVGNRRVAVASDLIQVSHTNPQAPVIMQVSAAVIRSAPEYKRGDGNASVLTGPRLLASGQPADTSTPSSAETISVKTSASPDPSPSAPSAGE